MKSLDFSVYNVIILKYKLKWNWMIDNIDMELPKLSNSVYYIPENVRISICNKVNRTDLTIKLIAFMPLYHFAIMNTVLPPPLVIFTSNKLTAACRLFACVYMWVWSYSNRAQPQRQQRVELVAGGTWAIYTHIYIYIVVIESVFQAHMAKLLTFCTGFINFVKYFILNIFGCAPGPKITFLHTIYVYIHCV